MPTEINEYDFNYMTGRLFAVETTLGILCRALVQENPKSLYAVAHNLDLWRKAPENEKLLMQMPDAKQQGALEVFQLVKGYITDGFNERA